MSLWRERTRIYQSLPLKIFASMLIEQPSETCTWKSLHIFGVFILAGLFASVPFKFPPEARERTQSYHRLSPESLEQARTQLYLHAASLAAAGNSATFCLLASLVFPVLFKREVNACLAWAVNESFFFFSLFFFHVISLMSLGKLTAVAEWRKC